MSISFNWIAQAYYFLLWCLGFYDRDGNRKTIEDMDKITFMLRRSEDRLGVVWYLITISIFLVLGHQVFALHRWWLLPVLGFQTWLFIHVLLPSSPPPNEFEHGEP